MREPARWGRRAIAAVAAMALAIGVALVAQTGPAPRPPEASGSNDPAAACQDLRAGAVVACLHGNDAPPTGVSLYERPTLQELEARSRLDSPDPRLRGLAGLEQATSPSTPGAEPAAVSCIGDGTSGSCIQAIYARALDVPDRYEDVVTSLREWMAEADQAVWTSAGQTGAGKRLRFVTDNSCQLDVARVTLTPVGDDSFSQMRTELVAHGFTRTDRKYLVWVDAAVGICGLGEVYGDTRPGPENRNNRGPSYARVDTPCWQYAELHEIFHNLGAVQRDAPHPSAAWHCTDEADVMRSSRGAGVSIARYSLTPAPHGPPTTTPDPPPPPPTGPPIDNGGITTPTVTLPTTQPTTPAATHSPIRQWLPGLAGVTAATLTGLAMWLLYRRRHPAGQGPRTRSHMAS
jgi:hypothetical protein